MFPFVISPLLRILSLKRICPMCKKGQIVSSDQKRKPVKCKFCGATVPAKSVNWRLHTQPDLIPLNSPVINQLPIQWSYQRPPPWCAYFCSRYPKVPFTQSPKRLCQDTALRLYGKPYPKWKFKHHQENIGSIHVFRKRSDNSWGNDASVDGDRHHNLSLLYRRENAVFCRHPKRPGRTSDPTCLFIGLSGYIDIWS